MDEKRKKRLEALSKLAGQDKTNVVSDKKEYFENLAEKRKDRARAAIAKQSSPAAMDKQMSDDIKLRALNEKLDNEAKKKAAAKKAEKMKNYKSFLEREYKK